MPAGIPVNAPVFMYEEFSRTSGVSTSSTKQSANAVAILSLILRFVLGVRLFFPEVWITLVAAGSPAFLLGQSFTKCPSFWQ
jgi:hypothetical protein